MSNGRETPTNELPPEALVLRIGEGDSTAETELVQRFSRPVMTMLQHRTGDVQRAEDVHQDTFCIVLERLRTRSIDDPSRISAFIHRTAINVLIGDYRKEARRETYADTELIQRHVDRRADQLQELIRTESGEAIRSTIQELGNDRDKELLYRFYILQEEKPVICKVLALTSEHFDRVISRARKRFRQLLERRKLLIVDGELGT